LHLVGILFPHINDDVGQNHIKYFVSPAKNYEDEQIEKNAMGAMLRAYGKREMLKVFSVEILEKTTTWKTRA